MKKITSLLLVIAIMLSLSASVLAMPAWTFDDTDRNDWFNRYVEKVTDKGWMNGVGDRSFDPNGTLSRAMFVTILYRMAGEPATDSAVTFKDVQAGSWYENAVKWAAANNVVTGYTDGRFGVNDPLTREQMATILFRSSVANGMEAITMEENLTSFADHAAISEYAVTAMNWAVGKGILTGTGTDLAPKATSTRAQAAAVLCRFDTLDEVATMTRADLEQAVVELAWDYFVKGPRVQYDSQVLNSGVLMRYAHGGYRVNEDVAPEYGTADTSLFSVCSDYTQKVYLHALNECLFGDSVDWLTANMFTEGENVYGQDITIARYWDDARLDSSRRGPVLETTTHRLTAAEMRQFFIDWEKNLRPGDLLLPNGHAMLYIGNGYVLDCAGSKYDLKTGKDVYEGSGAVSALRTVIGTYVDGTILDGIFAFPEGQPEGTTPSFAVMRPINLLVSDDGDGDPANDKALPATEITDATRTRMEYPAMDIDRTVSAGVFGNAVSGGTLTYTVAIRNASNNKSLVTYRQATNPSYVGVDYKAVPVTELIPAGTELVAGSISEGGTYADGKITWNVDIPAGQAKNLTYTVKVTAPVGAAICAEGGSVGNIASNSIVTAVGGEKFGDATNAALFEFYYRYYDGWEQTYGLQYTDGITMAEEFYNKVLGKKLDLPDLQTLFDSIFEQQYVFRKAGGYCYGETAEAWPYTPRADVYEKNPMLIRRYLCGEGIWFPCDQDRINEFRTDYLEPGDILFHVSLSDYNGAQKRTVKDAKVLIWLGDGDYATIGDSGKLVRARGSEELWKGFLYDAVFALRPTQAGKLEDSGMRIDPEGDPVTNAETKQARQEAVVASMWAFIDKEEKMQHDAIGFTKVATSAGGNGRTAIFAAPEDITKDHNWYGTIQGVLLNTFMDALGYAFAPSSNAATYNRLPNLMSNATTVYEWTNGTEPVIAAADLIALLEPGDILEATEAKKVYNYGMYLGDGLFYAYEIADATRYNQATGVDVEEVGGAGEVVKVSDIFTDEYLKKVTCVHVARFVDAPDYDRAYITPVAKSRQEYPRMVIDRTVNVGPYTTVLSGTELTYTTEITNKGTAAYTALPITETVPAGTELVKADGAKNENGTLTWSLDVPAGETKAVSFTVKVTAEAGARIVAKGGSVANIPSNTISTTVGKDLITAEATARMTELSGKSGEEIAKLLGVEGKDALAMARAAYSYILTGKPNVNVSKLIPMGNQLYKMFKDNGKHEIGLYTMPTMESASNKNLRTMIVDNYYGGHDVHVENLMDRLAELRYSHLMPGDILTKSESESDEYAIYLGDGKFLLAVSPANTLQVVGDEALTTCFKSSIRCFALTRPSQLISAADLG